MKKCRFLNLTIFVTFLLIFSYLQANVFLLINGVMEHTKAYKANISIPDFLYQLSHFKLMAVKYLTGSIYVLMSYYLLYRLSISCTLNHRYRQMIRYTYIVLAAFIIFFHSLSFVLNQPFQSMSLYLFKIILSPIFSFVLLIIGHMPIFNETLMHNKRKY